MSHSFRLYIPGEISLYFAFFSMGMTACLSQSNTLYYLKVVMVPKELQMPLCVNSYVPHVCDKFLK